MDEQPRDPGTSRKEVVERREVVETGPTGGPTERVETTTDRVETTGPADPVNRVQVNQAASGPNWLIILPLVLIVAALAWFIFARGERTQIELPTIETPSIEAPTQRIEIEVPAAGTPATEPAQPAEPATRPPGE